MEAKVVSYKLDGTQLIVLVDPNKDGTPVLTLTLSMIEVLNEIMSALKLKA